ncbi:hypothetical protein Tco_0554096 [Tanacetum coccineum]
MKSKCVMESVDVDYTSDTEHLTFFNNQTSQSPYDDGRATLVEDGSETPLEHNEIDATSSSCVKRRTQQTVLTPGVRKSSRQTKFPIKFNNYVLNSNVKYGIAKFVSYSSLKGKFNLEESPWYEMDIQEKDKNKAKNDKTKHENEKSSFKQLVLKIHQKFEEANGAGCILDGLGFRASWEALGVIVVLDFSQESLMSLIKGWKESREWGFELGRENHILCFECRGKNQPSRVLIVVAPISAGWIPERQVDGVAYSNLPPLNHTQLSDTVRLMIDDDFNGIELHNSLLHNI